MSFLATAIIAGVMSALALAGCASDGGSALRQICRAEDGRGNVYQAADFEMLDAIEAAVQQCETAALDPSTCVARGCRSEQ